jgi:Raf kinase inhibitor-like YbhB/YbcL family protein
LFNIPSETRKIEENSVPKLAVQGINSFNQNNYGGPCPPSGTHRYFFKVYALATTLSLDSSATRADVEAAIGNSVIASAELIGLYSRG